jgi:hypothetical protein
MLAATVRLRATEEATEVLLIIIPLALLEVLAVRDLLPMGTLRLGVEQGSIIIIRLDRLAPQMECISSLEPVMELVGMEVIPMKIATITMAVENLVHRTVFILTVMV